MSPRLSDALLRVQSDDRLVMLARSGHERAFVAIVERYRRPLHAFARRLAPEARVEDVLQQSFVNAWTALSAGAEVRHLRGWLHQIVRNASIAAARTPGEDPLNETMIGEEGPQAEVERRLEVRETLHNVARLPQQQRVALVGTAMEGRSREEIAADLGLTEGAVRGLVHRARTTLRAAATAVTPMPLAVWAASGAAHGSAPVGERVAELVAGAGSASLAGATVKAGTAVVVSGALATSAATELPRTHHHRHVRPHRVTVAERAPATTPVAAPAPASAPRRAAVTPARVPKPTAAPAPAAVAPRHPAPAVDETERPEHAATPGDHEDARPVAPTPSRDTEEPDTTAIEASDDGEHTDTAGDGGDDAPPADESGD